MRGPVIVFLIAAVGWALVAPPGQTNEFRLEFYAEVRGLAEGGDYAAAERMVEEAFLASTNAAAEDRIELLDTLADVQTAAGKYSDTGDTFWNKATILARVAGPDDPDLAAVYAASGRAYLKAGLPERAVDAFEAALQIDRRYQKCEGEALAALYRNLAEALRAVGRGEAAERAARLADDTGERCALANPTRSVAAADTGGEGEFALVKVLYATDRKLTGSVRASEFYGPDRGELSFGVVDVTIPRIHKPGNIEAPSLLSFTWQENPSLHIVLMDVRPLSADAFFARVARVVEQPGSDEIFLFIHGFNVTFAEAAKRTAQLVYDLNFSGTPVFYSWPSRGSTGGYITDSASVQVSARHLIGFLEELVARSEGKRIQIVAHSMGNRALTEALEIYALRHPDASDVFDQIIFAAPDVDAELFVLQTDAFDRLARRMTLYTSNADLALATSRQLHGNPRAGLALGEPLVGDAFDNIDMSGVGAGLLNHNYFATDSSALSDMLWLFWRNPPPPSRCGMAEEAGAGGVHWIYLAEECDSNVLLSALSLARLGGEAAKARLDGQIAALQSGAEPDLLQELMRVRQTLLDLLAR